MKCDLCRQLEDAMLAAHNARVEARSEFELHLNAIGARGLFEKYREASDAYNRTLKTFREHHRTHDLVRG
jgi:hypothetical protein